MYLPSRRDIFSELDYFAGIERQAATRAQRFQSPQAAARLSNYQRMYPWMRPGTMLALSEFGLEPDSNAARKAAFASGQTYLDQPTGEDRPVEALRPSIDTLLKAGETLRRLVPSGNEQPLDPSEGPIGPSANPQGGQVTSDPTTQRMMRSRWFDKDTGTLVRPSSERDRALFARELRQIAGSSSVKVGVPYFDPERGSFLALPQRGEPRELRDRIGLPADDMEALLKGDRKPQAVLEREFVQLSVPEQAAKFVNQRLHEDRNPPQGGVLGTIQEVTKSVIRGIGAESLSLAQEVQGQFRNVIGTGQELINREKPDFSRFTESQSDLGIIRGQNPASVGLNDFGTGFVPRPEAQVGEERLRRELERGNVGGHVITAGRFFANQVSDPDTLPFNVLSGVVDMGVALKADPAFFVGKGISRGRQFQRMFMESGGILGLRNTVTTTAGQKWLAGADARPVAAAIGRTTSFSKLDKAFNHQLPPSMINDLTKIADPEEILNYLKPHLGSTMRVKPRVSDIEPVMRRFSKPFQPVARQFEQITGRQVDLDSARDSVNQTRRMLTDFRVTDEKFIDEALTRMAGAEHRLARRNVLVNEVLSSDNGLLVRAGVPEDIVRRTATLHRNRIEGAQGWSLTRTGDHRNIWTHPVLAGGKAVPAGPKPQTIADSIGRHMPMPDSRGVARATSKLSRIRESGANKFINDTLLDTLMEDMWKPSVLMRFAWPLRVISEEQFRIAAAGFSGMANHPISAMAWMIGRKGGLLDDSLRNVDEGVNAMAHGSKRFRGRRVGMQYSGNFTTIPKTTDNVDDFLGAWADEIAHQHSDTINRIVAGSDSADAARGAVRGTETGKKMRKILFDANPEERPGIITDAGSDVYTNSRIEALSDLTNSNPALMKALATGKLDGIPIHLGGTNRVNPKFVRQLDNYINDAPEKALKGLDVSENTNWWDHTVDAVFTGLMSIPTNALSRSPVFRQAYWQRIRETVGLADPESQAQILSRARQVFGKAGDIDVTLFQSRLVPKKLRPKKAPHIPEIDVPLGPRARLAIRDIESSAKASTGALNVDDLDALGKSFALDFTKNLLYDISQRSRIFEATRVLFPFGEAWKEVVTRWGSLVQQNPQVMRRAQQIIQGAESEELGETLGAGAQGLGPGFFWKNANGEMVFVYPGSQFLNSALFGVPVPLVGNVQGLNMVGEMFPGFGPVAQVAAEAIINQVPSLDGIREVVSPYGPPDAKMWDPASWVKEAIPPWFERGITAINRGAEDPNNGRVYGNATMSVMGFLASQRNEDGELEYELWSEEPNIAKAELQRLEDDAAKKSKGLHIIRALSQFFLPAAPSFEWLVRDDTGSLVAAAMLTAYHRELQETDFATADERFTQALGTSPFVLMQSKSESVTSGYPVTKEGENWVRDNPDVRRDLPNTFGFFAPQEGEFHYPAYLASINRGDRKPLSPHQFLSLSIARMASIQYGQARDEVLEISDGRPSQEQQEWLSSYRKALEREYPGYREARQGGLGLTKKASFTVRETELREAVNNPKVAKTDAGQGLKKMLEFFDLAREEADRRDRAFPGTARDTQDLRDWVRNAGWTIARENPGFLSMWEQVFDPQLDTEE